MKNEVGKNSESPPKRVLSRALLWPSVRARIYLLLVLNLILFANSFWNSFTYDDFLFILHNPSVHNPENIVSYFIRPFPPNEPELSLYRPLVAFSYLWDWCLGYKKQAPDPSGFAGHIRVFFFHLTNLLVHMGVVVTLLLLLQRLFPSKRIAFWACLVFSVHPVHAENVTSIVGRTETLSSLFFLLSLHVYIRGRERQRLFASSTVLSCLLFFAALLSKESAITLPFIILLTEWYLRIHHNKKAPGDKTEDTSGRGVRSRDEKSLMTNHLLIPVLPYLAILLVYLIIRIQVIGILGIKRAGWYFHEETTGERLVAMSLGFLMYLKLLIVPLFLSIDYNFPLRIFGSFLMNQPHHVQSIYVLGALVILLGYGGLILWGVLKKKKMVYPLLWFPITLFPFSNIIPFGDFIAERFLYLPSVGYCIFLGMALEGLRDKGRYAKPVLVLFILLLVLYGARTLLRNRNWRTDLELWSAELRMNPHNPNGYFGVGTAYTLERTYHLNKGNAFRSKGDFRKASYHLDLARRSEDLAIQTFETGIKIHPRHHKTYQNYGGLCVTMREPNIARAEEILLKGAACMPESLPDLPTFYHYLGIINVRKTPPDYERGLEFYRKAHGLEKSRDRILVDMADALIKMNRLEQALTALRKVLSRNPANRAAVGSLKQIRALEWKKKE